MRPTPIIAPSATGAVKKLVMMIRNAPAPMCTMLWNTLSSNPSSASPPSCVKPLKPVTAKPTTPNRT